MSNWKCPFCGGNNLSTNRSCPGCGCLQSEAVTAEPKKAVGYYAGKPIYDVDEWIELGGHLADPGARLYSPFLPPTPRPLIPPKPEPDGVWIGGYGGIGLAEAIGSLFAMLFAVVVYFLTRHPVTIAMAILMLAVLIYVLLTMCTNSAD